ncbi:MAG: AMP-binding protein, partial [Povalibacter sp.]
MSMSFGDSQAAQTAGGRIVGWGELASLKKRINSSVSALLTSTSLVEVFRSQTDRFADRTVLRFLSDQEGEETLLTYADLDIRARSIAAHLQAHNGRGERALLLHPPGPEYVAALLGCFYAGVIAVPAYPPRMNRSIDRLQDIIKDARARFGLTTAIALGRLERQQGPAQLSAVHWIATDQCARERSADWQPHTP